MQKENSISNRNATAFPEASNEVFDIIQEQIFNDQFSSETSAELDKVFFKTLLDEDMEKADRLPFVLMYVNLKKLLIVVSKNKVPKNIKNINIDVSYCF